MSTIIQDFKEIPKCGIIAFTNKKNRTVYLIFSNSLYTLFCTQLCKLREGIHDNKLLQKAFNANKLECKVVRSLKDDATSLELRCEYQRVMAEYNYGDYKDMRERYKAINYKLKKYILNDFRQEIPSSVPLVYVCARSPSAGEVVLGIFDSMPDADDWIQDTYGRSFDDIMPEFADNKLTKQYIKEKGYKIFR